MTICPKLDLKLRRACVAAGSLESAGRHSPRRLRKVAARTGDGASTGHAARYGALLTALVENSTDGIAACDREGRIISWNRAAETIFGFTESEAVGRLANSIMRAPPAKVAEQRARLADALAGVFEPRWLERLRKDGTTVMVSINPFGLPDSDGLKGGFGAVIRDVTDLIQKTEALARQNEELQARDRQMRALAARLDAIREEEGKRIAREVHDELGQLLTSMKWDLQRVESRLDDPSLIERLRECSALADRTIVAVQRIATALRPIVFDSFGLPAAIRDEARRFQARTDIQVHVEADDEEVPEEPATALFRIFQEVMTNVARHARAGKVTVRFIAQASESEAAGESATGPARGEWILDVRDDGIGFGSDADTPARSLGLLGMRERAELLSGTVQVETGPGRGTRVLVRIPKSKEHTGDDRT